MSNLRLIRFGSVSHESPVKGGGNEGLPLAIQDLNVQKWSILWRTIILSALGKTTYPYCRHLRFLDLRDLGYLLDDDKFRGKVSQHFFEGPLERFHFTSKGLGRITRLDRVKIISAIGDEITQQAPLLEAISEPTGFDVLSSALLNWIPRLEHLQRLDLFDGKAFADERIRNLLHAHCPNLEMLKIYRSSSPDADHALATFISGMPENRLIYFENHSDCGIGTETCLALNTQGKSLKQLKLALTEDGVLALGLLQGCTALRTLAISSDRVSVDLKATQNDVYLEIVEWLNGCHLLKDVSFQNIASAPDLTIPILLNKDVVLEELDINATKEDALYVVKDHHDFHRALSEQPTIHRLHLHADPDPMSRDDIEILMNALCSLKGLRELRLTRISDYFTDEHIILLAKHLPDLEEFTVGGYGISDAALSELGNLKMLKALTFGGVTTFTPDRLMDFIDQLGAGNEGLVLSIDMADPDSAISEEEQELLRELIVAKADGRFEYQLLRGPFQKRRFQYQY